METGCPDKIWDTTWIPKLVWQIIIENAQSANSVDTLCPVRWRPECSLDQPRFCRWQKSDVNLEIWAKSVLILESQINETAWPNVFFILLYNVPLTKPFCMRAASYFSGQTAKFTSPRRLKHIGSERRSHTNAIKAKDYVSWTRMVIKHGRIACAFVAHRLDASRIHWARSADFSVCP